MWWMITIKSKWPIDRNALNEFNDNWRSVRLHSARLIRFDFSCFSCFTSVCRWANIELYPRLSLLAGRSVTEGEVEEMLESGNPAVFTQGVRIGQLTAAKTTAWSILDYGRNCPSETIAGRYRSSTWWYYQIREKYQRIARHVHWYGCSGSNPGKLVFVDVEEDRWADNDL